MKLKNISRIAAVICAAAAVFAVSGLRLSDAGELDSAAFRPSPQVAAETVGAGDGALTDAAAGKDNDRQNDSSKSDNSSPENAAADSGGLSRLPGDNSAPDGGESCDSSTDKGRQRQVAPDSPSQPEELPGDEPEDGDDTDEQLFVTSIKDGEHVTDSLYSFTITHLNESYKLKTLTVRVNGRKVHWSGSVTLADGRNIIGIYASYTDAGGKLHSGFREYTVWLDSAGSKPDKRDSDADSSPGDSSSDDSRTDESEAPADETHEPELVTDLAGMTTSEESISFTAFIRGGSQTELKVYTGGKRLYPGEGDMYTCPLKMGLNTVKLKATGYYRGDPFEIEQSFSIRRTAETTPETAPRLSYHNIPDEVRGDSYTLDLIAEDYSGNRIYDNGITVLLNGGEIKCSWIGEYTSYLLRLTGGENTLDIRLTDSEGRTSDYSFVIVCTAAGDGEVIGVCSLRLDANVLGLGELISGTDIEIRQGEPAVEAIVRALEQNGFETELRGSYIARISRAGMALEAAIPEPLRAELEADSGVRFTDNSSPDSLGERDYTSLSGWMIAVNGHFISYGAGDLHLKDGDLVQLRFTLAAGRDIGDTSAGECYETIY